MAVSPQVEAEKIAGQPGFPPALQHPESVRLHLTFAGQDQAFLVVQGCWGPDAAQVARAAYDLIASSYVVGSFGSDITALYISMM